MQTINTWYGCLGTLPSKATSKKLNEFNNWAEFQIHFNWILNLARNEFKYENLPPTMDRHYLEDQFIFRGKCSATDIYGKPFAIGINPYNTLTIFGKPAKGQAVTADGKNFDVNFYWEYLDNANESNSVLGYDNPGTMPPIIEIIRRAEMLADTIRAIETAIILSKIPAIITGPEELKKSLLEFVKNWQDNTPIYVGVKKGIPNAIEIVDLPNTADRIKDLTDAYNDMLEKTMRDFGINVNTNSDKKERMTQLEVVGNVGLSNLSEQFRLEERKEFIERVNKKFGTNIVVKSNYNDEEQQVQPTQEVPEDDKAI